MNFVVRLKGKPAEYLDLLIKKGFFQSKAEAIRMSILYLAEELLKTDKEIFAVANAVENEIKNSKKTYSEKEFREMFYKE